MARLNAAVVWEGPSALTGEPIAVVLTGLGRKSKNDKTGAMIQAYIIDARRHAYEAIRDGNDRSVCGDCPLRGSICYVNPHRGLTPVSAKYLAGGYPRISPEEAAGLVEGRAIRFGAYGDPAAAPFDLWLLLAAVASNWTGYTHQWRTCDQRFSKLLMASVETPQGAAEASGRGWRYFRARVAGAPTLATEVVCPASAEAGYRTDCASCGLCKGTARVAKDVVIVAHGRGSKRFAAMFGGAS